MQRCSGIIGATGTLATGLDWSNVGRVATLIDVECESVQEESVAETGCSRWVDTIEHVNAKCGQYNQIQRIANAHLLIKK